MTPSLAVLSLLAASLAVALWLSHRQRRLEASFRAIVEGAGDVILRIDAEGRIAYANPATGELIGQEAGRLVGRPFVDLVRDDYREQARRFYEDQRRRASRTPTASSRSRPRAARTSGSASACSS